jgi:hypothetical protein
MSFGMMVTPVGLDRAQIRVFIKETDPMRLDEGAGGRNEASVR